MRKTTFTATNYNKVPEKILKILKKYFHTKNSIKKESVSVIYSKIKINLDQFWSSIYSHSVYTYNHLLEIVGQILCLILVFVYLSDNSENVPFIFPVLPSLLDFDNWVLTIFKTILLIVSISKTFKFLRTSDFPPTNPSILI